MEDGQAEEQILVQLLCLVTEIIWSNTLQHHNYYYADKPQHQSYTQSASTDSVTVVVQVYIAIFHGNLRCAKPYTERGGPSSWENSPSDVTFRCLYADANCMQRNKCL
ncbi:hypothetical protein E2C01_017349 [Portunus trituberculatus]|uniref:Uncharacterized protein n=1 Tax=Portunus trituberculatus TaxID=210409 RepID=A0A5B7DS87_PORTR|nr:hypothetical protein [Portunus trituberculatus]